MAARTGASIGVAVTITILGALSLAFFVDAPQLGYTASHSLWHIFSAASGVSLAYSVRSAARGTHGIRA